MKLCIKCKKYIAENNSKLCKRCKPGEEQYPKVPEFTYRITESLFDSIPSSYDSPSSNDSNDTFGGFDGGDSGGGGSSSDW